MERELIGPYRILRAIGKGGMGTVYEGVHEQIERRVAIKILHREFVENSEYAERFLNEAKAVNRIGHPGIVQIHEMAGLPDGTAYLVMELLVGETVGQRLKLRGGRLPLDEAISIAKDVSDALAAAHSKSIIHRDLKPDNIMLVSDPVAARGERCKLLDFGIAKFVVAASGALKGHTQIGTVMGTLWYMSPEQLRDTAQVNDRTDVYALGALLYQLLSGRVPFLADSEAELIAAHLRDTPQELSELIPEVPERLSQLVSRMLEKDLSLRPTMREVARELSCALPGPTISGSMPVLTPAAGTKNSAVRAPIPATLVKPLRQPLSSLSPTIEPLGEVAPPLQAMDPATLSGSASLLASLSLAPKQWLRLTVMPALGLAGVGAVLLFAAVKQWRVKQTEESSRAVVSSPVATKDQATVSDSHGPASVPPPATPKPTEIGVPSQPPATVKNAAPSGIPAGGAQSGSAFQPGSNKGIASPSCRLESPTVKCIHGSLLPGMDGLIAASLRSADIKLCPSEELRLHRYGNHFLFEGALRRAPRDRQTTFGTSLQGRVGSATLPEAFVIKCAGDKNRPNK